jgi:hypothetical protein
MVLVQKHNNTAAKNSYWRSPAEELVGTKRESTLVVPGVPLNPLHTVQNSALRDMYLDKTEFWQ